MSHSRWVAISLPFSQCRKKNTNATSVALVKRTTISQSSGDCSDSLRSHLSFEPDIPKRKPYTAAHPATSHVVLACCWPCGMEERKHLAEQAGWSTGFWVGQVWTFIRQVGPMDPCIRFEFTANRPVPDGSRIFP